MKTKQAVLGLWVIVMLFAAVRSHAAHPLITDDTGTQGAGKFQLEVNAEYGTDKETAEGVEFEVKAGELAAILSYGVLESVDIVFGLPYAGGEVKEDGSTVFDEKGLSDVSLELKWRFLEAGGASLAFKPGVSVPTGDEKKGLGSGKYGFSTYLIGTYSAEPWAFHLNLGYHRNNNTFEEEENLWHASLASEFAVSEAAAIVANIGIEKNPDKLSHRHPSFALVGIIFSVAEDLDLDLGYKLGLSDAETDHTYLAGLALRF